MIVETIWISLRRPFANDGRSGRSVRRHVRIASSWGRPSGRKNEPGILPAAYCRSSTSTVSGKKSRLSFGFFDAVVADRTMLSSLREVTTDPAACWASRPASKRMVRSPSADLSVVSANATVSPKVLEPVKGRLLSSGAPPRRGGLRSSIEALGLLSCHGRHYRGPALTFDARRRRGVVKLAAETESLDQRAVALHVLLLQVAQQPPATADELKQPTLGVEVVLVDLHVFGQVTDAPAEQRDLDLGRARVTVGGGVVVDDLLLDGVVEGHAELSWCHPAPGLYRLSNVRRGRPGHEGRRICPAKTTGLRAAPGSGGRPRPSVRPGAPRRRNGPFPAGGG